MLRSSSKFVALMMAVLVPWSFLVAETGGAMVYATNSVLVNGTSVDRTSAILPGDVLSVPQGSTATVALTGTSILMPAFGKLTFNGASISLQPHTAVWVTTSVGTATDIKDIRIAPRRHGPSQYQVARYNGNVVVAAKQGEVVLADAGRNYVVPEGRSMTVPDPEPQKPGAIPATVGIGVGAMPSWLAELLGAAAVAAAGFAIYETLGMGAPASPAKP